ncbi:MAG: 50S ribosomal protein L32 [Candidatus Omnitrophica bacterium]|nr:50S ribosomal protein L32 [Candidatus Omnitrophota bacterium]
MSKPKHRHSKERTRKRRTHYKAEAPAATKCDQCGQAKRPHRVCPACGYYKGTQVKKIETLEERKERREKKQGPQ